MATASVASPQSDFSLVPGISTKDLSCKDALARLIQPDFIRLVDPKKLIIFLPPDLLTDSDEDRVVCRQDSMGREDGAKLLLALISQRPNWLPRLLQGLTHNEIRLHHLADRIAEMQAQVPMEVDFPDSTEMEVDAEPAPPTAHLSPNMNELLAGRAPAQLNEQELKNYTQLVLTEIAKRFFLQVGQSVEEMKTLTECYERIMTAMTTGFSFGCLEMRLKVSSSSGLRELRGLLDGGALHQTIQRQLLTEERRKWLVTQAASYGLNWRQVKVQVRIRREDLDHCATFLKVKEEPEDPHTSAEALLLKTVRAVGKGGTSNPQATHSLPNLLVSFLDWLLIDYPYLAEKVASILVSSSLDIGITETMAKCREFFGLRNEYEADLTYVASEMLKTISSDEASESEDSSESTFTKAESKTLPTISQLHFEVLSHYSHEHPVYRLREAKLMTPVPEKEHVFQFSSLFVADFALSCTSDFFQVMPTGYASRVLKFGSPFALIHIIDLLLSLVLQMGRTVDPLRIYDVFRRLHKQRLPLAEEARKDGAKELLQFLSSNDQPQDFVDMYLACYRFINFPEYKPLFQRFWTRFSSEWKILARNLLTSGKPNAIPEILICRLSSEDRNTVSELNEFLSLAKHTLNLTGKLADISLDLFKVILAWYQLTNVGKFELILTDEIASLRLIPDENGSRSSDVSGKVQQLNLKLCQNMLSEELVECLLDALPGMESLPLIDFTGCTISQDSLQKILNNLPMKSVQTLILNNVSSSDARSRILPRFSHLKRLQAVDLGYLGLQDEHMSSLAQQLSSLPDLQELVLDHNHITTIGLSQLNPALAPRESLRLLSLSHCQLDTGAAFVLGALLTSAYSLEVLNLSHCHLEDPGLQHLAKALQNHTQLRKVSLRNGGYSPGGLASFLTQLAECDRMQHLELGQCPLEQTGHDVSDKLLKVLAGSSQWDFLGLWKCNIGQTTFLEGLSNLRVQLRGLTSIVFQENDLDAVKIGHLADAVQQGVFRYLSHLNLRQNSIGEAGVKRLVSVLPLLPRLSELLLQHCAISPSGAVSLARMALRLPRMKTLNLSNSYATMPDDVPGVIDEIRHIVLEENVVIGEGVGFAKNDHWLENQFAEEKLQFLKESLGSRTKEELHVAETKGLVTSPVIYRRRVECFENRVIIDGMLTIFLGHK